MEKKMISRQQFRILLQPLFETGLLRNTIEIHNRDKNEKYTEMTSFVIPVNRQNRFSQAGLSSLIVFLTTHCRT